MKIQYCSDLHLEFPENKEFLKKNPLVPMGEILILAGDIVPFAVMDKHDNFFSYLSDNFQTTYWIPGNHEYYYYDISEKSGTFTEKIKENVFLINNTSVVHDNVKFIFSTLWSKISPANQFQIESAISDFHVIKYNGNPFTSNHFNQFHDESMEFLKSELNQNNANKTIVVTHHVPTFMNYPEKYKGDIMNEAFAVELFDLIEDNSVNCWIYGHTHNNNKKFNVGNTQLLTNQLGYVKYGEHELFNHEAFINI